MAASSKYPTTVNLRLSEEMKAALESLAAKHDLSVGRVVRKVIKLYLDEASPHTALEGIQNSP